MKTLLVIILGLGMLVACTSKTTTETTASDSTIVVKSASPVTLVTWNEAGIRDTPGEKGKYLTSVYLGEELKLMGDTASDLSGTKRKLYHKVELSDGKSGWVRDELIAIKVFPGAMVNNAPIFKRPDAAAISDQQFQQGDFIVAAGKDSPRWLEVTGKRADDKWFTTGYVVVNNISFDSLEVQYAILKRRLREETKQTMKDLLSQKMEDADTWGGSQLWRADHPESRQPGMGELGEEQDEIRQAAELLGYYNLSGDGNDVSGHNNGGIVSGAVPTADRSGAAGMALNFDGKSFITLTLNDPKQLALPFSVSAWFKTTAPDSAMQTLVSMGRSPDGTGFNFGYTSDKGKRKVFFGLMGAQGPIGPFAITNAGDGKWHQLTGTCDEKAISLYLDGVLVDSQILSVADIGTIINQFDQTTQPIEIGRELESLGRYFYGSIDEVIIFRISLDKDAVKSLFEDGYELH